MDAVILAYLKFKLQRNSTRILSVFSFWVEGHQYSVFSGHGATFC